MNHVGFLVGFKNENRGLGYLKMKLQTFSCILIRIVFGFFKQSLLCERSNLLSRGSSQDPFLLGKLYDLNAYFISYVKFAGGVNSGIPVDLIIRYSHKVRPTNWAFSATSWYKWQESCLPGIRVQDPD